MKSKWKVGGAYCDGCVIFKVYRLKDKNGPDNVENREVIGDNYTCSSDAMAVADYLNREEAADDGTQ